MLRSVVELARADFLERARRYGFLATLGAVAYLGYTVHAGWWVVRIDRYVAAPGPAWTGTLMAVVTSVMLSLVGFYVVRGTVERDRRTGVGPVLAATRATRLEYAIGKLVSNLAVLGAMVLVLGGLAVAMEAVRGDGISASGVWEVVSPFLLLVSPMLVAVAGVALLFDALPWLRGTAGGVAYFFLWVGILSFAGFDTARQWTDFSGIAMVYESMEEALHAARPGVEASGFSVQIRPPDQGETVAVPWSGLVWSLTQAGRRLLWVVVGGILTVLAALALRTFDPFGDRASGARKGTDEGSPAPAEETGGAELAEGFGTPAGPSASTLFSASAVLTGDPVGFGRLSSLVRMVRGELRLLLSGHSWWWWTILAGANLAAFFVPGDAVTSALLVAWLTPISAWSSLGCRERIRGTEPLLFSAPGPGVRQLSAQWTAGVTLAVLTASGPTIRLLAAGEIGRLLTVAVGAAFVPALALCLGVWSGTAKLFEPLYLVLWYLGPLNEVPFLDYMGVTGRSLEVGATPAFGAATWILLLLAWLGRVHRLRAG